MLFNSYVYALFLPLVFLLYQALSLRGRQIMLLIASYLFYCWETPVYGLLLLVSTVLDFSCGLIMNRTERPAWRRFVLLVSMCGNLGLLGFFKYGDFFGENLAGLGRLLGFDGEWKAMGFILPVGISFYTFQTMSYTIQLYRRQIEPCRDPISFALFVSFFPQLVAGPIERASHLLPQLQVFHRVNIDDLVAGGRRIVFGLFRKAVLADRYAILVDRVYAHPEEFSTLAVWVGVVAFWMQIYFDFAGYADIAIGSARLFGIRLTENFRRPLVSRSMAEFWSRWHITLTNWLKDYVFVPVGGGRRVRGGRAALSALFVLTLCGLWHGAAWHFVLWGAFEGVLLVLYYVWRGFARRWAGRGLQPDHLARILVSVAFVFACHSFAALLFRCPDMSAVARMLAAMFGRHEGAGLVSEWYVWVYLVMIVGGMGIEVCQEYLGLNDWVRRRPWWMKAVGMGFLIVIITLMATNTSAPYIYFQF